MVASFKSAGFAFIKTVLFLSIFLDILDSVNILCPLGWVYRVFSESKVAQHFWRNSVGLAGHFVSFQIRGEKKEKIRKKKKIVCCLLVGFFFWCCCCYRKKIYIENSLVYRCSWWKLQQNWLVGGLYFHWIFGQFPSAKSLGQNRTKQTKLCELSSQVCICLERMAQGVKTFHLEWKHLKKMSQIDLWRFLQETQTFKFQVVWMQELLPCQKGTMNRWHTSTLLTAFWKVVFTARNQWKATWKVNSLTMKFATFLCVSIFHKYLANKQNLFA